MGSLFKNLFYVYVILLALYVTYNNLAKKQLSPYQVVFVKPQKECQGSGNGWSYCVYKGMHSRKDVILYVLHAKDQDEKFWDKNQGYSALLQQYWQDHKKTIPTVVTVSFGDLWLATRQGLKPQSGILERMKEEVFPRIEGALGKPRGRFLMGESMGGLNALSVALALPGYFSRVAALCPPLFKLSPYASWKEMAQFLYRSGAQPKTLITAIGVGRYYFANEQEWLNFSPLERVKRARFRDSQHFYLTAGIRDAYGIYPVVEEFHRALKSTGANPHFMPNSGGHCSVDVSSLARFFNLK